MQSTLKQNGGRALPGLLCILLATILCSAGCNEQGAAGQSNRKAVTPAGNARSDSQTSQPSNHIVDSILPLEEEIRRFRAKVPETPTRLSGGAGSRDELVRRWVKAVEGRDSVALGRMVMNAAEYITLYYPESPYTHAPYRQSPGTRWGLITNTSMKGALRVWNRHAGIAMGFAGYHCDPKPEVMGRNRIWTGCVVNWKNASGHGSIRLFGPIIEREGEFKFVTYASDY